jgi:hypothetical protein
MDWGLMKDVVIPVSTALAGIVLGFGVTRWNEALNEQRERHRAVSHILSELLNAKRHYRYSCEENLAIEAAPEWVRVVQLGKCRFYGNGLGSFEMSALRHFEPVVAESVLDFMLTVRNNDFYIDQAIKHAGAGQEEQFRSIVKALLERFQSIEPLAARVEGVVRARYAHTGSSQAS